VLGQQDLPVQDDRLASASGAVAPAAVAPKATPTSLRLAGAEQILLLRQHEHDQLEEHRGRVQGLCACLEPVRANHRQESLRLELRVRCQRPDLLL